MHEMEEDTETKNERFWLEMTKNGTLSFCHELLKISPLFQKKRPKDINYEDYLKSLDEEILKYLDLLIESNKNGRWGVITPDDSPFPSDLHGYIHEYNEEGGWFQPKHLMCKLAVLRDDENAINYEFLIEYDILSPDVEIYFGVKAISDSWDSTEDFRATVIRHWDKVRHNRYLRYAHRFKMTNNVNHGTFWPFWWRMSIDCKEELADTIQRIRTFYEDYKKELGLKPLKAPIFDKIEKEVKNSLLSNKDYTNLIDRIEHDYNKDIVKRFKSIIKRCIDDNLLFQMNNQEKRYYCTGPTIKVIFLIRVFFICVYSKEKWEFARRTPVEYLSKVILDKHGRVINKSNWRKDLTDITAVSVMDTSIKTVKELFPDYVNILKKQFPNYK